MAVLYQETQQNPPSPTRRVPAFQGSGQHHPRSSFHTVEWIVKTVNMEMDHPLPNGLEFQFGLCQAMALARLGLCERDTSGDADHRLRR